MKTLIDGTDRLVTFAILFLFSVRKQKDDMQVNVAGLRRNIKNLAHNYSDAQVKVREATSNDPWGPSATIMAEIADLTYNVVAFSEIMQMIWKRLNDHGKNWRHVYKALILLEYLIKTGTEKVAQQCKENIFAIQTLREFVYFEEGKDQGTHVREKAKSLVNLLKDDERLKNERIKALKAKERFAQHPSGFGSDGYIDGPSQRDMPPGWQEEPKPVSELEMVRPQTAGEEELQLQLAMAMSREEAEQEEAKRRSDDVRLQLALSQSEQDFKEQNVRPAPKKEEQQSHLLDLLDISLGATSISSPPLGAAGGVVTDPWGTPARAASQLSDPWSGTSSPQIDPWQPNAANRPAIMGGAGAAPTPLGAVGGIGTNGGDAWALRTHSPSVASGSSTEGWLHNNGGAMNGNIVGAGATVDSWLTKTTIGPLANAAPLTAAAAAGSNNLDPWLADSAKPAAPAPLVDDPWAPKAQAAAAGIEDPWKSIAQSGTKKISPDIDEFDIITNRNKTGDILTNNSISSASNNNNASLLDEMDPLSSLYGNSTSNTTLNTADATTNAKKPLKTPQAFLGENSSLVNLDNLIKPIAPQTQMGSAAYNPFSDTVIPPKTNLFQQQQPVVPSINQLKQQQPFAMSINQDPWAPVNTTNVTSQQIEELLIDYDNTDTQIQKTRPSSLNLNLNQRLTTTNAAYPFNNNNNSNNQHYSRLQATASDQDFNSIFNVSNTSLTDTNNSCSSFISNLNSNMLITPATTSTITANNNYNCNQNIDDIRNMEIFSEQNNSYSPPSPCSPTPTAPTFQTTTQFQFHNNNHYVAPYSPTSFSSPFTESYSSALSASLATTPGIKISPFTPANINDNRYLRGAETGVGVGGAGGANNSTSLFDYGFYDSNNQLQSQQQRQMQQNSSLNSLGYCKMENNNNNNNNNMPWIKPTEAAATNPFLS